jgi:hypothetical protein
MRIHEIGRGVFAFQSDELGSLLEQTKTIGEVDTRIAGHIRTLRTGDRVLVQERTPDGDHFVRELASKDAASRFVEARLAAYERMWDG